MRFNIPNYGEKPKKRRRRILPAAGLFFLLLILFLSWRTFRHPPLEGLDGPYPVVRVVDGDTFIARVKGEEVRIRLIGVDTPESVHPDKTLNTPEGEAASEYASDLLEGEWVYLEYDLNQRDRYGRTLAYVYLEEGEMVQELLLREGYAQPDPVEPNTKYAQRFQLLAQMAG